MTLDNTSLAQVLRSMAHIHAQNAREMFGKDYQAVYAARGAAKDCNAVADALARGEVNRGALTFGQLMQLDTAARKLSRREPIAA